MRIAGLVSLGCTVLLVATAIVAQETGIDSLEAALEAATEDMVRWTIREVHSFEGEANQADDITGLAVQARGSA